jgi:hypothetical protein
MADKILAIKGKLSDHHVLLEDMMVISTIMKALPREFSAFLESWSMFDVDQQTLDRFLSKLLERARLLTQKEDSDLSLLARVETFGLQSQQKPRNRLSNGHNTRPSDSSSPKDGAVTCHYWNWGMSKPNVSNYSGKKRTVKPKTANLTPSILRGRPTFAAWQLRIWNFVLNHN